MSPILRVQSPLFILQWKMVLENLEKEWCMMCNDCLVYIITKPIDCSSKLTKQTKEKRRRFRNFEVNSILSIPSPNSISRQSRFRRRRRCGGTIERGQCVGARDSVGSFARSSSLLSLLVILLLPHKSKIHVAKNICILQSLPISHEIVNPSANIQEASRGYQHFLVLM